MRNGKHQLSSKRAKVVVESPHTSKIAADKEEGKEDEAEQKEEEKADAAEPIEESILEPIRSIVENQSLATLIEEHTICRKCKIVGQLSLKFPSTGLGTIPRLVCHNCQTSHSATVQGTGLPKAKNGSQRIMDFAANVLYVLGFLTSRDGGSEVQKVLGMLGLPVIQSMEKDVFRKVENAVGLSNTKTLLEMQVSLLGNYDY
jgi:hypothetical protein